MPKLEMDPVTAITTVLSLIPDLLVTNGGRLIAGAYVGGRYFSTTALLKSGYIYSEGLVYAAGRRRNPWVRFLKVFRKYVSKTYNLPNRRKIAKEIYNELKKSGQLEMLIKHHKLLPEIREKLDQMLVIKPKTGLELALSSPKTKMEFPHIFTAKLGPMEFPYIFTRKAEPGTPQIQEPSMEFPHIGLPEAPIQPRPPFGLSTESPTEAPSMEFPMEATPARLPIPRFKPTVMTPSLVPVTSTAPTIITQQGEIPTREIERQVAQENIAEAVQKTVQKLPTGLPEERKAEIVAQNIQETQKQLLSEGNVAAIKPSVVVKAAADVAIRTTGEKKETISKAVSDVTGTTPQEVKQEIKQAEQTVSAITNVPVSAPSEEKKEEKKVEAEEEKKKEPELVASGRRRVRRSQVRRSRVRRS